MIIMKKYWIFILILCLLSGGIGLILGGLAEIFYALENQIGIGWNAGPILGVSVAIAYSFYLVRRWEQRKNILAYGTLTGIAAGVICSTLVHAVLWIAYGVTEFIGMGIGALFGIAAGLVLGFLSSALFTAVYVRKQEHAAS